MVLSREEVEAIMSAPGPSPAELAARKVQFVAEQRLQRTNTNLPRMPMFAWEFPESSTVNITTRIVLTTLTGKRTFMFISAWTRLIDLKVFYMRAFMHMKLYEMHDDDCSIFNKQDKNYTNNTWFLTSDYEIQDEDMLYITPKHVGGAKTKQNITKYYTTTHDSTEIKKFMKEQIFIM